MTKLSIYCAKQSFLFNKHCLSFFLYKRISHINQLDYATLYLVFIVNLADLSIAKIIQIGIWRISISKVELLSFLNLHLCCFKPIGASIVIHNVGNRVDA